MATSVDCVQDLITRVMQVSELAEKTVHVRSEKDLLSILKLAKFPMAGVVYGGTLANALDSSRQGLAQDLTCTVLLIIDSNAIGGLDLKNSAIGLLQSIYEQVSQQTSPTGHKWVFNSEVPAGTIGNADVYRQRWTTKFVRTETIKHPFA